MPYLPIAPIVMLDFAIALQCIPNVLFFSMFSLILSHWASIFQLTFRPDQNGGAHVKSNSTLIEVILPSSFVAPVFHVC
jgi:hypothetical protein